MLRLPSSAPRRCRPLSSNVRPHENLLLSAARTSQNQNPYPALACCSKSCKACQGQRCANFPAAHRSQGSEFLLGWLEAYGPNARSRKAYFESECLRTLRLAGFDGAGKAHTAIASRCLTFQQSQLCSPCSKGAAESECCECKSKRSKLCAFGKT